MGRSPERTPVPRSASPLRLMAMVALVAIVGAVGVTVAGQAMAAGAARWTAPGRPAAAHALWVWDTSDPQAVVGLATSRGIGQLYAAVPPHVDSSPKLAELQQLVALADAAGSARRRPRRRPRLGRQPGLGGHQLAPARRWPPGCSPASTSTSSPTRPPPGRRTARPSSRSTSPPSTPSRTAAGRHADRGRHPVLVRRDPRERLDPGPRDHAAHRRRRRDGLPQPRSRTGRHDRPRVRRGRRRRRARPRRCGSARRRTSSAPTRPRSSRRSTA